MRVSVTSLCRRSSERDRERTHYIRPCFTLDPDHAMVASQDGHDPPGRPPGTLSGFRRAHDSAAPSDPARHSATRQETEPQAESPARGSTGPPLRAQTRPEEPRPALRSPDTRSSEPRPALRSTDPLSGAQDTQRTQQGGCIAGRHGAGRVTAQHYRVTSSDIAVRGSDEGGWRGRYSPREIHVV